MNNAFAKLSVAMIFILMFDCLRSQMIFNKQWDKRYGGKGTDVCEAAVINADGTYTLVGYSDSENDGDKTQSCQGLDDFWVVKIDAQGNKLWDKRYGGNQPDVPFDIKATPDGGYIILGQSASSASGDKSQNSRGSFDCWVVKLDMNGNKQWDRRYGTPSFDYSGYIAIAKDNGYLISATTVGEGLDKTQPNWDTSGFYSDAWLIRIDSFGNKLWDKRYGGIEAENCTGLIATDDGGFVFISSSLSDSSGDKTQSSKGGYDVWVVKIDSDGTKIWDKAIGGTDDDSPNSFALTADGGFIIGARSYSPIGGDKTVPNEADYWIVKVDKDGNKMWDKAYGGNFNDDLSFVATTLDGGFLFSGRSNSELSGDKTENNLGHSQLWLVKTDSLGNKEWDKTIFSADAGYGFAAQTIDNCFITWMGLAGKTEGYNTEINRDITGNTPDYWVMKFCMDPVGMEEISTEAQVNVYPNPFLKDFSINIRKDNLRQAAFFITNSFGQAIYKQQEQSLNSEYTKSVDLSYLPAGIYFLDVTTETDHVVKRIIKE